MWSGQDDAAAGELDEELDPDDPEPDDPEPEPDDVLEPAEDFESDDELEDPESEPEELPDESDFDSVVLESDDPPPFTAPARLSVR
ncbi:hypothetical protein [Pseudonocardia sp. KRD291]|uniref:hypothetical protein n=1 Tax=Pseudonocardia sp. KRD291 TaxID=2792007 RepID=UPI0027E34237|nr:hypothetical protein [Pseudonocardia sp. KRD291]